MIDKLIEKIDVCNRRHHVRCTDDGDLEDIKKELQNIKYLQRRKLLLQLNGCFWIKNYTKQWLPMTGMNQPMVFAPRMHAHMFNFFVQNQRKALEMSSKNTR